MKAGGRTFESCPESYGDGRVCRRDARGRKKYRFAPGKSPTEKGRAFERRGVERDVAAATRRRRTVRRPHARVSAVRFRVNEKKEEGDATNRVRFLFSFMPVFKSSRRGGGYKIPTARLRRSVARMASYFAFASELLAAVRIVVASRTSVWFSMPSWNPRVTTR